MLLPIVRSAQRISIRSWASTSCVGNHQVDFPCITIKPGSQIRELGSNTRAVSSVAVETPKITENLPAHLQYDADLIEEHCNPGIFQGSEEVPVYFDVPSVAISNTDKKSDYYRLKKEKALKKFTLAEKQLEKTDPKGCKLFRAIKKPLLELEQYRASALIDIKACSKFVLIPFG